MRTDIAVISGGILIRSEQAPDTQTNEMPGIRSESTKHILSSAFRPRFLYYH